MPTNQSLFLHTWQSEATAGRLWKALAQGSAVAQVNIIPGTQSIKRCQGKTGQGRTHLLADKIINYCPERLNPSTAEGGFYELPEVLAVSIDQGLADHLHWIGEHTK